MKNLDPRHLRMMKSSIRLFREGKIGLREIISDLERLNALLEDVGGDWKETFIEHWGELEITFSLHVVEGMSLESPKTQQNLHRHVDLLEQRIDKELSRYPPYTDEFFEQ